MAPRNIVEWIAGGNAPAKDPPAAVQRAPRKILRVTVSTDSEDSSGDEAAATINKTSKEACKCKKVRFEDDPKKSAMKKCNGEELAKQKPKEPQKSSPNADSCYCCCWFCGKSSCDSHGKGGKRDGDGNTNGEKQDGGCKSKGRSRNQPEQKRQHNNAKQPSNTKGSSVPNSNTNSQNQKQTQEQRNQDTARKHLAEFVRQNMSRLILPSRAEVLRREDVIECPSDPRPNAFFDYRSGILRVYHGPVYGNPFGTLVPLDNPSVPIGTPSPGGMAGGAGRDAFSSFGTAVFGSNQFMPSGHGVNGPNNGDQGHGQEKRQRASSPGSGNDSQFNSGNQNNNSASMNTNGGRNSNDASNAYSGGNGWGGSSNNNNNNAHKSSSNGNSGGGGWGDSGNENPTSKNDSGNSGWGDSGNNNSSSMNDSGGNGWGDSGNNNNNSFSNSNSGNTAWGDSGNNENVSSSSEGRWGNSNDRSNDQSNNQSGSSGWGASNDNGNHSPHNSFSISAQKDAQADGWGVPSWGADSSNDNNASGWGNSTSNDNNLSWDKIVPDGGETALSGGSWADGGTGPTPIGQEDDWGKPSEKASWGDPTAASGGNSGHGAW